MPLLLIAMLQMEMDIKQTSRSKKSLKRLVCFIRKWMFYET